MTAPFYGPAALRGLESFDRRIKVNNLYHKSALALEMARAGIDHYFEEPFLFERLNFKVRRPTQSMHTTLVTGFIRKENSLVDFQALAHLERWPEDSRVWQPFRIDLLFDPRYSIDKDDKEVQCIVFCRFADSQHNRFVLSDDLLAYREPKIGEQIYCPSHIDHAVVRGEIETKAIEVDSKNLNRRSWFVDVRSDGMRWHYQWDDVVFRQEELRIKMWDQG